MNAELIDQLLKAYTNGDWNLESFGDSPEKTSILETIASWKSQMYQNELTTQKLQEIKTDLDTAENEEEQFRIILNVLDNYEITPEAREVLKDYSDLLGRIRKLNKAYANGLRSGG